MAENKNKLTFMVNWYESIMEDENIDINNQEMAYILFAAAQYAFYGEKINIGDVFGKEFKILNMAMPNIYSQMDNIKSYGESQSEKKTKYNSEEIKACRLKGLTAKETCRELGYPESKANSLTSNKGWIEAGKILEEQKQKEIEKTSGTDSVQTDIKSVRETEEKTESVQKANTVFNF